MTPGFGRLPAQVTSCLWSTSLRTTGAHLRRGSGGAAGPSPSPFAGRMVLLHQGCSAPLGFRHPATTHQISSPNITVIGNCPSSSFPLRVVIGVSSELDHFSAKLNQSQPTSRLSHNSCFLPSACLPLLSICIVFWPDLLPSSLFCASLYPSPRLLFHTRQPRDRRSETPQPAFNNNKNKGCSSHAKVAERCGQDLPPGSPRNLCS